MRYTNETPVARKLYARMVADVVRPLGVGLLLEPGRSIIAPSAVLLSKVIYTKKNSTKSFVIIDAAMNDLARPVLYDAPHPVTRVHQAKTKGNNATQRVDIVGPVCETGDCFLKGWPLGQVEPGDTVAIWTAGAYGMVQASNYNGRRRPAEILVKGNRARLIRRRETQADLLRTEILCLNSSLAPLQFAAQNFEIGLVRWMNQLQSFQRPRDAHAIAGLQRHSGLSVQCQEHRVRILSHA